MKHFLKIITILVTTFVFSQEKEIVPPYNIKTITFSQNVNNTIPFFGLGENFDLQFDDLYGNEADYFYTIEQYNYDWTPSQLLKNEYLNGLDNQRIQNYQNSLNCLQIYSHYTLSFPNKFNQIIKSGNYIVKIFDEDQEIVFSKKFIIYEDNTAVGITIRRSRDMETVNKKQNIEFFIDYKDKPLQNPKENVKVSIFQNGKLNSAIHNIKPQYTKVTSGDVYNTILYTNEERKNKIYTFFPDVNGNFFVNNLNATQNTIEADYTWVYFGLASDINPLEKSIYVTGMFNNYQISDEFKMEYNSETKTFEKPILLKQGFTNYQYTLVDKNGKIDEQNAIDGNFYQTENEYIVLVYYRGGAERYDRIIGIGRANSTEIKN